MKKLWFFLTPILTMAPMVLVSCNQTNNFYLAQKEVRSFLTNLELNKIDLKSWNNKQAIKEIEYLKYLLNTSTDKEKYSMDYFDDRLELKVYLPFLDDNNSSDIDITKTSIGRMMKIAHADHFHTRFVTWNELPPTKEEKAKSTKKGYKYIFKKLKNDGSLDWSQVSIDNDFLRSDNFPKIINLASDKKTKPLKLKEGTTFSKFKIKDDDTLDNFLKTLISDNDLENIKNNKYVDSLDKNYSWRYNGNHENLLLSNAAIKLGIQLVNILSKSDKVKSFGYDEINMNMDLFNYWLVNKPSAHYKSSYDSDEIIKMSDFLDLNEIQLKKLNKITQGNVEFENFLLSLNPNDRKILKKILINIEAFYPKNLKNPEKWNYFIF